MLKMTSTDDYNFDPLIKILAKSYKSGLKDAGPDEINGAIRFVHETVKSINSLIDRGDTRKIQKSLVNLAYGLGLVFKDSPDEKQFVSLVNAGLIRVFKNVDRIAKTVNLSKHKVNTVDEYLAKKEFSKKALSNVSHEASQYVYGGSTTFGYQPQPAIKSSRQSLRYLGEFLSFVAD